MNQINNLLDECISCVSKPCMKGCPLENDTTGFIALMKKNKFKEAYELLCDTSVLQPICGRICPHTKQCQGSCIKRFKSTSAKIGQLEAYLGDMAIENNWNIPMYTETKVNKKIAIIGSGPCGLSCSAFLARNGFDVTIFEKYDKLRRNNGTWYSRF